MNNLIVQTPRSTVTTHVDRLRSAIDEKIDEYMLNHGCAPSVIALSEPQMLVLSHSLTRRTTQEGCYYKGIPVVRTSAVISLALADVEGLPAFLQPQAY